MKWTTEQIEKVTTLAYEEVSNKEIAEKLGVDVKDVYALRSRLGITISKVKQTNQPSPTEPAPRKAATINKKFDDLLTLPKKKVTTDKALFMWMLEETLKATDIGVDHLEYDDEYVTVIFDDGYKKKICVAADSRIALIRDVARRIN